MTRSVCILGSTGSIGCSALDVISRHLNEYQIEVLTAHTNVSKLLEQCEQFKPKYAVMLDDQCAEKLRLALQEKGLDITVLSGQKAIDSAAELADMEIVIAAIVGAAGLLPTLLAVKRGMTVLLANKEALVMSGEIFNLAVKENNATLLPVDSEHNAIFQCLPKSDKTNLPLLEGVSKVMLTGSGGPFRRLPLEEFSGVTPEQACAHPNWDMGKKISVDSATMMNKGLELIEACFLFGLTLEQIELVVHPQSIVHSMVSYDDGSVLAQMGNPDMRTPIAHTLAWPSRINAGVASLDFFAMSDLTFEKPDFIRFPCLQYAIDAMRQGGTAPCVLNAANEMAVAAFLSETIRFSDIPVVIKNCMALVTIEKADTLEAVLSADRIARDIATQQINHLKGEK